MKNVYKTRSGLEIGKYYDPKQVYYSPDQDWLQSALLGIKREIEVKDIIEIACTLFAVYFILCLMLRVW
jgi:hypothetical protein